mgnify:FL=1
MGYFWKLAFIYLIASGSLHAGEIIKLWAGKAPNETRDFGPEKVEPPNPKDKQPVKRITNISDPSLELMSPKKPNGTAVIVCPGGGHRILAWDKEGTEIGEWLNSLGITAFILKYRVPSRNENKRYEAAVQDAQRAISIVRSKASEYKLNPQKIGIIGFSAGGETAALAALFEKRIYEARDDMDQVSQRPNFAVLVYPAYLVDKDKPLLMDYIKINKNTPSMFLAHANDDRVSPLNSSVLYSELKKAEVASELHIYSKGGHGFGLRPSEFPSSKWPVHCGEWLRSMGWIEK